MDYKYIRLPGMRLSFFNWKETVKILINVLIRNENVFKTDTKTPFILDCGAHIGISVLSFKKQYSESEIIAFEPSPRTFELLKLNVKQNNLKNVTLVNAALSDKEGSASLYVSRDKNPSLTSGDTLVRSWFKHQGRHKKIKIRTVKLSSYINKPVDFLKMDIEGSETEVFKEIKNKLYLVKNIVLEFHATPGDKEQLRLNTIYRLLKSNNFASKVEREIKMKDRHILIIQAYKK